MKFDEERLKKEIFEESEALELRKLKKKLEAIYISNFYKSNSNQLPGG